MQNYEDAKNIIEAAKETGKSVAGAAEGIYLKFKEIEACFPKGSVTKKDAGEALKKVADGVKFLLSAVGVTGVICASGKAVSEIVHALKAGCSKGVVPGFESDCVGGNVAGSEVADAEFTIIPSTQSGEPAGVEEPGVGNLGIQEYLAVARAQIPTGGIDGVAARLVPDATARDVVSILLVPELLPPLVKAMECVLEADAGSKEAKSFAVGIIAYVLERDDILSDDGLFGLVDDACVCARGLLQLVASGQFELDPMLEGACQLCLEAEGLLASELRQLIIDFVEHLWIASCDEAPECGGE